MECTVQPEAILNEGLPLTRISKFAKRSLRDSSQMGRKQKHIDCRVVNAPRSDKR